MLCTEKFYSIYRQDPEFMAFCPYRVCPIGAHIDHQLGKITGFAIDRGIHIAYKTKHNGVIELCSLQFDKRAQWHVAGVPETKVGDWADYLRGVTLELAARYPVKVGLCGVIEGTLPIGGLSSSAAVCLSFLSALCKVNNISLEAAEMMQIAKSAENKYVGVSCGLLDQSCEVLSREGHILYLDTKDLSYELIPEHKDMKPYRIGIFFSGLERSLTGSAFNMRVDECRSAAYAVKAFAGMPYGKFAETCLRDISKEDYLKYRERLPETWQRRADHYFSEMERVEAGAEAWRRGDIEAFGKNIFESGHSSIELYQTGSPELKAIYEILLHTDGVYGGRFSGAGFKGCCMAIIDPDYAESIQEKVEREYLAAFPELRGKYMSCICRSADGANAK